MKDFWNLEQKYLMASGWNLTNYLEWKFGSDSAVNFGRRVLGFDMKSVEELERKIVGLKWSLLL